MSFGTIPTDRIGRSSRARQDQRGVLQSQACRAVDSTSMKPRLRAAAISPHAESRSRPSQEDRYDCAVNRRHDRPDNAGQRPPVADERFQRGRLRRDASGYQHTVHEWPACAQPDAVVVTVADLPANEVIRRR